MIHHSKSSFGYLWVISALDCFTLSLAKRSLSSVFDSSITPQGQESTSQQGVIDHHWSTNSFDQLGLKTVPCPFVRFKSTFVFSSSVVWLGLAVPPRLHAKKTLPPSVFHLDYHYNPLLSHVRTAANQLTGSKETNAHMTRDKIWDGLEYNKVLKHVLDSQ